MNNQVASSPGEHPIVRFYNNNKTMIRLLAVFVIGVLIGSVMLGGTSSKLLEQVKKDAKDEAKKDIKDIVKEGVKEVKKTNGETSSDEMVMVESSESQKPIQTSTEKREVKKDAKKGGLNLPLLCSSTNWSTYPPNNTDEPYKIHLPKEVKVKEEVKKVVKKVEKVVEDVKEDVKEVVKDDTTEVKTVDEVVKEVEVEE